MSIMNIYYTGTNGNARQFASEIEYSGLEKKIREEEETWDMNISIL